jgi:NAD(P)-dependent dehydrogenase (short-subunit alcohol dehydrogenase family)
VFKTIIVKMFHKELDVTFASARYRIGCKGFVSCGRKNSIAGINSPPAPVKMTVLFARSLVNNAGTAIPKTFEEATWKRWTASLISTFAASSWQHRAALKHMRKGGRVIMIGSAVGERVVVPGLVPYSATKGAVKIFTQALSREVGNRGITINNVQPGPIDTELNPAAGDWALPQKAATDASMRSLRW